MKPASPARRVILPAAAAILISAGAFYAGRFFPFEGASGSRGKAPVVASIPDPRKDVEEQKRTGHARSPTKATPVQEVGTALPAAAPVLKPDPMLERLLFSREVADILSLTAAERSSILEVWAGVIPRIHQLAQAGRKVTNANEDTTEISIAPYREAGELLRAEFEAGVVRILGEQRGRGYLKGSRKHLDEAAMGFGQEELRLSITLKPGEQPELKVVLPTATVTYVGSDQIPSIYQPILRIE